MKQSTATGWELAYHTSDPENPDPAHSVAVWRFDLGLVCGGNLLWVKGQTDTILTLCRGLTAVMVAEATPPRSAGKQAL